MKEKRIAKNIALYYALMSGLFLALSPQFLGFLFPILFILPIYLGLNGIKNRKKAGYYISLGIVPLAMAISVLWVNYIYHIMGNLEGEFMAISQKTNISIGTVQTVTSVSFVFSIILLILAITMFIKLIKNRQIFVKAK